MSIYLLLLLCCIVIIVILIIVLNKRNKVLEKTVFDKHELEVMRKEQLKDYFKEEWDKQEKHLQDELEHHKKEIELRRDGYEKDFLLHMTSCGAELKKLQTLLKEKEKRYEEVNQDLDLYREGKIKEIDGTAAEYEQRKHILVAQSIDKYRDELIKQANDTVGQLTLQIDFTKNELNKIQIELEEERTKRAAINEEILRQRKLEQEQDFYRIQLDEEDTEDIEILRSVTVRLRHPEAINKVIWTGYYQKPLAELRKRLLTNGDISGVYKITRLKTGEIYIGQTTSIDKRWQEHVKSSLGVGNLASSQLHRVMKADGPENFTFEVLEQTPKDKLRERESYYIDFYDSKTYGLNSVTGDKNK